MLQIPFDFMMPKSDWKPTPLSELPRWDNAAEVSIDTETHDPDLKDLGIGVRRNGFVVGISFKLDDLPGYYLPIRHASGNLPESQVWKYMKENAKNFRGKVIGANLSYDLDYLLENGVSFDNCAGYEDVQVYDPLIYELHDSYSLAAICERWGELPKDNGMLLHAAESLKLKAGRLMVSVDSSIAGPYAIGDVERPMSIVRKQRARLKELGVGEKIIEIENKLIPILVRMRRRGIRIDQEQLEKVESWSVREAEAALARIKAEHGYSLSVDDANSSEACARVLSQLGFDIPKTATGKSSIKKEFLESIKHPVGDLIRRCRKMTKLRTTFVQSIKDHMVNGRIHCSFHQSRASDEEGEGEQGVRYGRLSCSDPNLQQQPGRDPEIGPLWRSIYVPDEGKLWAALDFSQQEPRMTVHFAEQTNCSKAREAAERYRTDPKADNHTMMAQLIAGQGPDWKPSKKERSDAKIVFLGLAYSMGGAKLAHGLNLPTEFKFIARLNKEIEVAGPEAQAILDGFNRGVPFVRELNDLCQDAVRARGRIRTILGRHLHFEAQTDPGRLARGETHDKIHKALNRLIQGSCADQAKCSIVLIEEAGHELQLQMHDEMDLSVNDEAEARKVAEIMSNSIPLRVPMKVDVEIGPSWGGSMS